jgi:ABC-type multidrug transport system ATPase subunit
MQIRVIETFGLTRRFGEVTAVDQVDLCVPAGCVYGFLGPNGAGKTTTIRMLLGLIRPNSGRIMLLGGPLEENRASILRRIGSLVEEPSLYAHLTAGENLEIMRILLGAKRSSVARALKIVGLEKDAGKLVRHLSTGMRQRLGLGMALLGEPSLLILDEPTNGLDPSGIHEMRDLIRRLPVEEGVTVFLSSHLLSEVEQMATQIGIIRCGKLIFQGAPEQLRARYHEHITLQVDRPGEAQLLLSQAGWKADYNGNHNLYVAANGTSDVAMVNRQLVGGGFNVFQLSLEQPTLEDIFLKLTNDQ